MIVKLLSSRILVCSSTRYAAILDTRPVSSGQPPLSSARLCPVAKKHSNTVYKNLSHLTILVSISISSIILSMDIFIGFIIMIMILMIFQRRMYIFQIPFL